MLFNVQYVAAVSVLIAQAIAAPTPSTLDSRTLSLKGPVIFLSNCFNTNGASYAEFDYYSDVTTTVLKGKPAAPPTLSNIIYPTTSADYTSGGTFVTASLSPAFYAIISIDENDFSAAGVKVGNGKTTTFFWAQICYEMTRATVYSPSAAVTCTADVYCVQGPVDTTDL